MGTENFPICEIVFNDNIRMHVYKHLYHCELFLHAQYSVNWWFEIVIHSFVITTANLEENPDIHSCLQVYHMTCDSYQPARNYTKINE